MAIYNNFLNTPYDSSIPTIVIGTAKNFISAPKTDKAFIVYCDPLDLSFLAFVAFFKKSPLNTITDLKREICFKNKRIMGIDVNGLNLGMKLNLYNIFREMQSQVNNNIITFSQPDNEISKQKFFTPYYIRTSYKTQYWSILTLSELMIQLNLLYETPIHDLLTNQFSGLRVELNYDMYCPFYDYPIRFVFQYIIR